MTPAPASVTLELTLPVADIAAVRRRLRGSLGRPLPLTQDWHDDVGGSLARRGIALAAWQTGRLSGWRAEGLEHQQVTAVGSVAGLCHIRTGRTHPLSAATSGRGLTFP